MNSKNKKPFSKDIIKIEDIETAVNQLAQKLKEDIYLKCKRKGAVIGISGGIDSSVCLALVVKALGPEKVFGIMMPEKDSSPDSLELADKLAKVFGVETIVENISSALEGFRCYERRDEAVKRVFPEYDPSIHKMKIGIKESGLYSNLPPLFYITIIDQAGNEKTERLPANEFRTIMAASDFKQRSRMSILYYHAERLHYAVVGTPNKHEENQGFFVKYGDGGADVMPIAHLYKTQVYQLADYLNIPQEIIDRTPTTDTYPAEQTQEEFFFQLPFKQMDLLWYAYENKYNLKEVADVVGKSVDEVEKIFSNFKRKQSTTEYLRMAPIKYF
ncbi:MAG: NAD(+) synthase [Bacteroidetes bacterium]|nr:NAD(+) synthase [Bacteroidota bacterium]MBL7105485.1 NAD(+) synthase [Bacteroidales bacterium]